MANLNKISILIVDDEALIAEDIKEICELSGYDIAGISYTAGQALHAINKMNIDLVLLDINLEDQLTGIEIAQYINKQNIFIPFVFLTSYSDAKSLNAAKDTYPMGYVVKPFNKEQLISTIEISLFNYSKFKLPNGFNQGDIEQRFNTSLTDRENEILTLICEGKTNLQIADKIYLSVNTIKYHVKNIYEKMDVSSRTQLMAALR